jgi:hypothetical protein
MGTPPVGMEGKSMPHPFQRVYGNHSHHMEIKIFNK